MKILSQKYQLGLMLLLTGWITVASAFEKGQRVWIDMPAININDDSFGEGEVLDDPKTGQVLIYVRSLTTSKAFSSGVFCVPPSEPAQGWQTPAVYNIESNEQKWFPSRQLLPWTEGYNRHFERQNWLYTFLKWADHHPVIERSQLVEHRNNALRRQDQSFALVNALMVLEFDAYQTPQFKPYSIPEKIEKLIPVLEWIVAHLAQYPEVEAAWRPKQRDSLALNHSSLTLFMTEAIDKILTAAAKTRRLLLEKDMNANSQKFDQLMQQLIRR